MTAPAPATASPLAPIDISAYRAGNTGIAYVSTQAGPAPGPHVMIAALVHGNELCGAHALDALHRAGLQPRRGKLTLAFCNVAAYDRFDPARPGASRLIDEDFNRLWSPEILDGPRQSAELTRARQLRPLVDEVDLLLDLHSMQAPSEALTLCGPLAKGRALAASVGVPRIIVGDAGHKAGPRMRDYAGFADPNSPKNALLIECGQHLHPDSAAVATRSALYFLRAAGVLSADDIAPLIDTAGLPAQRHIEVTEVVTVKSETFRFTVNLHNLQTIPDAGTLIALDGAAAIETPYDNCIAVMPSSKIAVGATAVRLGREIHP